jgi:hypothetical protein
VQYLWDINKSDNGRQVGSPTIRSALVGQALQSTYSDVIGGILRQRSHEKRNRIQLKEFFIRGDGLWKRHFYWKYWDRTVAEWNYNLSKRFRLTGRLLAIEICEL